MDFDKIISEKTAISPDTVFQPSLQGVDVGGIQVFVKKDPLLDSELFGIKLSYIVAGAAIYYLIKKVL